MSRLTHTDRGGRAAMVDVGGKAETARIARAEARLTCLPETLEAVAAGTAPKGAVIQTAELAGMMAAKRTSDLIPMCHPLPLSKVAVEIAVDCALPGFRISAEARTVARTGVEMEALTAAGIAALTLFDMLKAIDRTMVVEGLRVTAKSGGKSGDWKVDTPGT